MKYVFLTVMVTADCRVCGQWHLPDQYPEGMDGTNAMDGSIPFFDEGDGGDRGSSRRERNGWSEKREGAICGPPHRSSAPFPSGFPFPQLELPFSFPVEGESFLQAEPIL